MIPRTVGTFQGLNYTMAGFEEVGYLGAQAAWQLGQWDDMSTYVQVTNENTLNGAYLRAIINVHHDRFSAAQKMVDKARSLLDKTMTAMIRESYNRAYKHIVLAQELDRNRGGDSLPKDVEAF